MNFLFLIPAREGSKRLPNKNIRPFCGKPLIHYAIEQAREFVSDEHILVSTDSQRILDICQQMGYETPYQRPAEFATDTASMNEVIRDAIRFQETQGRSYDAVVLLQPTSPMRQSEDIQKCMERYRPELDMVVTTTISKANPFFTLFETDENGHLQSLRDQQVGRSQDAPEFHVYNGCVYVINTHTMKTHDLNTFAKRIPVSMPSERSVDIDTELDWDIAELIFKKLNQIG